MEARHGMAARRVSLAAARLQRQQYQQELAQLEEQQQAMKADIAQMAPLMEDESLWSLSSPSAVLEAAAAERTPTKPSRTRSTGPCRVAPGTTKHPSHTAKRTHRLAQKGLGCSTPAQAQDPH